MGLREIIKLIITSPRSYAHMHLLNLYKSTLRFGLQMTTVVSRDWYNIVLNTKPYYISETPGSLHTRHNAVYDFCNRRLSPPCIYIFLLDVITSNQSGYLVVRLYWKNHIHKNTWSIYWDAQIDLLKKRQRSKKYMSPQPVYAMLLIVRLCII